MDEFNEWGVKDKVDGDYRNFPELLFRMENFGYLHLNNTRNTANTRTRSTDGAASYNLSVAEEAVVPAKGQSVLKTGLSTAAPDGCYGCIALRSGLAAKKHSDVGAGASVAK